MKKRNYSIDFLRVISMLGIIMIHIIDQGGVINNVKMGSINYYFVHLLYNIVYTSVNIFAIITGYLYIQKEKTSYKNIISLLVSTIFYSLIIASIFYGFNLFNIRSMGFLRLVSSIFPPIVGRYWYITCYVAVFCFIPYINIVLNRLTKEQFIKFLLLLFILFSIIPTFGLRDYFIISRGHSPSWLIYCYCIGAFLKKYSINYDNKKSMLFLFLILISLTLFTTMIPYYMHVNKLNKFLVQHNSPFIFISSLLIFMIISSIDLSNSKILSFLSKTSFAVYLIHGNILIYDFILKNHFAILTQYNFLVTIIGIVIVSCAIYIVCSLIESVRMLLFNKLKIDNFISKVGLKIDRSINI